MRLISLEIGIGSFTLCYQLKRNTAILAALALLLLASLFIARNPRIWPTQCGTVTPQNATVYFSPDGGCTEAVVNALTAAKTSVLVQAYSFTSAPIAKALVDAHKRGVKIQVILDRSNRTANYSAADFVAHAGIPTFIDDKHSIAHNKILVIDGRIVITGSFNFTKAAEEHNAENLLVIDDSALAERYTQNWDAHRQHSIPYERR